MDSVATVHGIHSLENIFFARPAPWGEEGERAELHPNWGMAPLHCDWVLHIGTEA